MRVQSHRSLSEIPRESWNSLCSPDFPFSRHEFLLPLETQGCVGPGTGWTPLYLTAWEGAQLRGATYFYEKEDSFGEFVFDFEWAEAYARCGLNYYPKLVSAVPFTPANGPKLLLAPSPDREKIAISLVEAARDTVEDSRLSGLHFLFIPPDELKVYAKGEFTVRHGFQYHWENRPYADFEDFLRQLRRKRKQQILSERRRVEDSGVRIEILSGENLTPEHGREMFRFCASTFLKKNGTLPYLTETFFEEIFQNMKERIVLFLARAGEKPVAAALHFRDGNALFGRYWGCFQAFKFLHFELCYYAPIQYAIERKLRLFEAGAGGEHKIQRGFVPTLTYSAHWIRHSGFRRAIGKFVEEEKVLVGRYLEKLKERSPYKQR